MTITGTQNRPYDSTTKLMVHAVFMSSENMLSDEWTFDWNDRESVRRFAADADRAIRNGWSVYTRQATPEEIPN